MLSAWLSVAGQGVARDIGGTSFQIINKFGRVAVTAMPAVDGKPSLAKLSAESPLGVSDNEIKVANGVITVAVADRKKRIDLILTVPERSTVKIETSAGAIDVSGNLAVVDARSDTGTISTDVPPNDVSYFLQWTESRPRVLADFDILPAKEKTAGRFEIKGRHQEPVEPKKEEVVREDPILGPPIPEKAPKPKAEGQLPKTVTLNVTTARGIILLNVPPNEVMSDLRERPLTNAAKAIIRSGDSLLMEAIRRASPKYFGDYARTLPPLRLEPTFAGKSDRLENPKGDTKTALVRVTDLQNRSIAGLTANDFEVTENGTVRDIVSIEPSTAPFNLVLLLDVSGSVENYVNFIRKAARSFVETVGREDRVSIVIFNDDVKQLSRFTTDKGKLSESLDSFDAGGGTAYYDALAYTISDTLRPLKGERTAIVILTDGDDNRSFLAFDSLAGSIQESGALIYPLYVPSGLIALAATGADIDPLRKKYMSLTAKSEGEGDKLAKISGGVYYPITQIGQIQEAYDDIVVQLRTAYNVTFRSDGSTVNENGASPKLKIRTRRENSFTAISRVTVAKIEK
ncbi:MAG: VWA domain-containing protein [Acidobacteria bacterium]|nr:VWA domain-containing protein [Acidobacteriota bacterium]